MERTLDLACARDLVREDDAAGGRRPIDPVVSFTLRFILMN